MGVIPADLIASCPCCKDSKATPATLKEIEALVLGIRPDASVVYEEETGLFIVRQPDVSDRYGVYFGRPIWHWVSEIAHLEAFLRRKERRRG